MEMIVLDDAVNPAMAMAAWASWPRKDWRGWHHYSGRDSEKYATRCASDLTPAAMECVRQIAGVVGRLVNPKFFPDMELHGAGMHMLLPGGYLSKHLDAAIMESTGWKREYSCVLSVNPEWEESWGGAFSHDGGRKVYPKFNTLTMFRTTEDSYHWVDTVSGPVPRCTVSLFMWSLEKPVDATRTQALFT